MWRHLQRNTVLDTLFIVHISLVVILVILVTNFIIFILPIFSITAFFFCVHSARALFGILASIRGHLIKVTLIVIRVILAAIRLTIRLSFGRAFLLGAATQLTKSKRLVVLACINTVNVAQLNPRIAWLKYASTGDRLPHKVLEVAVQEEYHMTRICAILFVFDGHHTKAKGCFYCLTKIIASPKLFVLENTVCTANFCKCLGIHVSVFIRVEVFGKIVICLANQRQLCIGWYAQDVIIGLREGAWFLGHVHTNLRGTPALSTAKAVHLLEVKLLLFSSTKNVVVNGRVPLARLFLRLSGYAHFALDW
mmetsp:Transcript_13265/g.25646  ORF Transcript_13265/g.25646 Transcript_13265/m.25646 type:complete len:308 (+) Transcript_13265:474-1397(+)